MKKVLISILILVMISGMLIGCSSTPSEPTTEEPSTEAPVTEDTDVTEPVEKISFKLAHDNATTTPAHKAFEEFKRIVEEKSNGNIEVVIFPGGQLGSVQDTLEQTRRGDIEMSVGATSLFTQTIPEFAVWDSFYLFDDAEHAHRVLDGKAGQELMKPIEKMGLKGLGYMEIGFRNFSNSVRPILKAEDVSGLKIRGYNPIQIKAWESLGANLTSLSWSEVFTSLQQNLIDGQESATESFYSAKFYEAQDYWSLTKHIYTNFLWYANADFMNGLSDENKQIINDAVLEAIALERKLVADAEEEILVKLPAEGVEVNEVPLEERLKMGEIMNGAIKDQILESCGEDIYNLVMEEVVAERK